MSASLKDARILIVDDDGLQCRHVARIVETWGAIAFTAETLADAVRLQREGKPDLVLLDVMMPLVDGYKLTQIFKRERQLVPVILLSALGDMESRRRALLAGADEFLTKPIDAFELEMRLSSMLRIKRLADELESANRRLVALATLDSLTRMPNRRMLDERLAAEVARAKRYKKDLACLLMDIDRFKAINDTWGHPVGDKVLMSVGATIQANIRSSDLGGRFGGEEFMVVAPELRREDAIILGERLRTAIASRSGQHTDIPNVTVSVGIATFACGTESVEELVARADASLYEAKRTGRDRIVCR
jgi:two-component system cell cycle response regulator